LNLRFGFLSSFLLIIASSSFVVAQQPVTAKVVPANFCVSTEEMKLVNMVNEYRRKYALPSIPLSKSLSYVASTHAKDLYYNQPDKKPCNMHSWSDKGAWKPFCYPRDEDKKNSVWDKPKEITHYKGKGFEIVYWENTRVNIDSAMDLWKSMDYFNAFLLNTGKWAEKNWGAIGIGICENYAVAWFGKEPDPEPKPYVCGTEPPKKDTVTAKKENPVIPDKKKEPTTTVPASKPTTTKPVSSEKGKYYIIVRSMLPLSESTKTANELIAKGYKDAKVLDKQSKLRVSIMEFQYKTQADSALREVKKTWKDAWILSE